MTISQRLDKLGAVNLMLAAAGEQPVSSLINNEINDTDAAQQTLNEALIETLNVGWDFNSVRKTLTPDSSGNIAVSPNYLRVDGTDGDYHRRLGVRGNKLYDLDNDTDVFTKAVTVKVTQNLDFDDLPQAFAFFVARHAAVLNYQQSGGDPAIIRDLTQHANLAWERLKKDNAKTFDFNWIHNGITTQRLGANRNTRYQANYEDNRPI